MHGGQAGGFALLAGLGQTGVGQQHHGGAVFVVEEVIADGVLEDLLPGGQTGLDVGQRTFPGQRGQRIAVIEPGGQGLDHGREPAREAAGIVFAVGEFHAVDGGLHGGGIDAVLGKGGEGLEDEHLGVLHLARIHALETGGVVHLAQVGLQAAAGGVLAQAGADEGLAQGRARQAFEDVFQHLHEQGLMHVAAFAQQPVDREQGRFLAVGGGVGHFHLPGRVAAGLQGHDGIHRAGGVALQGLGHDRQALFFRVIAPEEETRVGGMIVAAVEIAEGLVGQVRDGFRVAAGVQAVEHVREDGLLALLGQHGIGGGIGALHLVVDHALVGPGALGVPGLHVPAFLTEDVLADAGMEDRVDVDVDEVVKVLQVGAGHGVAGLVREGEGVEEGLERALEQLHEGLLDRIFGRAAEHGMLQDVGHARGIRGRGAEAHAEALVLVGIADGEQLRAGDAVFPEPGRTAHFVQAALGDEFETMTVHAGSFQGRFVGKIHMVRLYYGACRFAKSVLVPRRRSLCRDGGRGLYKKSTRAARYRAKRPIFLQPAGMAGKSVQFLYRCRIKEKAF